MDAVGLTDPVEFQGPIKMSANTVASTSVMIDGNKPSESALNTATSIGSSMPPPLPCKTIAVLCCVLVLCVRGDAFAQAALNQQTSRREELRSAFLSADQDRNRKLSIEEYVAFARQRFASDSQREAKARRDALLFDHNHDGQLDLTEFLTIPALLPAWEREAFDDPFNAVVEQYVARLDSGFQDFGESGSGRVPLARYQADLSQTLSIPESVELKPASADSDHDQTITRREAREHIERLLGVRRSNGQRIRFGDGRVLKFQRWQDSDINRTGTITRGEYKRHYEDTAIDDFFRLSDFNHDHEVSWDEFCRSPVGVVDVPGHFCELDLDPDGVLTEDELIRAISGAKQALVPTLFPAFDDNRDGKLSLSEFALTPLGNELLHWWRLPVDKNGNQRLDFPEFLFGSASDDFALLRWEMFRRLDTEQRGSLTKPQFDFSLRNSMRVSWLSTDGSQLQVVAIPGGAGPRLFDLCVGPHRESLAFGIARAGGPQIMRWDEDQLREVTTGSQSDWSPDGTRFAYFRYDQVAVLGICQIDGTAARIVGSGIRPRWSPDSQRLAFTVDRGDRGIAVLNPESGEVFQVFKDSQQLAVRSDTSSEWSPDGSQIAVETEAASEPHARLTLISATGSAFGLKHRLSLPRSINNLTWHPEHPRLVFSMFCPERRHTQLYELNPTTNEPAKLVSGQDRFSDVRSARWSRDGTRLWILSGE